MSGPRSTSGTDATPTTPQVVCLSGSLTSGSRSDRLAAWCADEIATLGATPTLFSGAELEFACYRLHGPRPQRVRRFLAALAGSDGIVLISPTYHGTVSGLLKNALDYVNDLDSATLPLLDGRCVGCVAVSAGEQGAASTLTTMRTITHALRAWPTPLGVTVCGRTAEAEFDSDGVPVGQRLTGQLRLMLGQVLSLAALNVRRRRRLPPARSVEQAGAGQ